MRQLSARELDQVKRAIAAKDLTSAEILVEIYDHYVSHLEGFESSEFEEQLFELEQKFKYSYCHALQVKFLKASKKEIFNLQWSILKSYFTWPKIIATAGCFSLAIIIWIYSSNKTKNIVLSIPIAISLLLVFGVMINSVRKVRPVKKHFKSPSKIESTIGIWLVQPVFLFSGSYLLFFKSGLGNTPIESGIYFPLISFLFLIIYTGYVLTLIQAWKIKTKTALI